MKEESRFFKRLLTASAQDMSRPAIFRCATILDDGRWCATNGNWALILTPPPSLAAWRSALPVPLDPLIDGARWGELPTISAEGLAFASGTIAPVQAMPPGFAKVIPSDAPQQEVPAWPLLQEVAKALAGVNEALRLSVVQRHAIRGTQAKKPGTYCRPPAQVAKINRQAITRIWPNGAWKVMADLHLSVVESYGANYADLANGEPAGMETGFRIDQVRAAVGSDRSAILGLRGRDGVSTVKLRDGLALIMPIRL